MKKNWKMIISVKRMIFTSPKKMSRKNPTQKMGMVMLTAMMTRVALRVKMVTADMMGKTTILMMNMMLVMI